ncbi:hypothetical protein H696_02948 [Fonticula alba]|uniref:RGS domain-containing protein n=1 Tax=Fonticula alba TaxID=691883 RepID=A0A058Z8L6_FONAL|nr:hypothetical protein H696_02948 [Fonticula alba]KCV70590.1 hypothetical protein H696_02948 [Fonticula alba]|eukprot:XP_009495106.1 hypothetical protein H696_02948 [Fonticula alba]
MHAEKLADPEGRSTAGEGGSPAPVSDGEGDARSTASKTAFSLDRGAGAMDAPGSPGMAAPWPEFLAGHGATQLAARQPACARSSGQGDSLELGPLPAHAGARDAGPSAPPEDPFPQPILGQESVPPLPDARPHLAGKPAGRSGRSRSASLGHVEAGASAGGDVDRPAGSGPLARPAHLQVDTAAAIATGISTCAAAHTPDGSSITCITPSDPTPLESSVAAIHRREVAERRQQRMSAQQRVAGLRHPLLTGGGPGALAGVTAGTPADTGAPAAGPSGGPFGPRPDAIGVDAASSTPRPSMHGGGAGGGHDPLSSGDLAGVDRRRRALGWQAAGMPAPMSRSASTALSTISSSTAGASELALRGAAAADLEAGLACRFGNYLRLECFYSQTRLERAREAAAAAAAAPSSAGLSRAGSAAGSGSPPPPPPPPGRGPGRRGAGAAGGLFSWIFRDRATSREGQNISADGIIAMRRFEQFCSESWCLEILLFVRQCARFENSYNSWSKKTRLVEAAQIMSKFIRVGATLEINLEHRVRRSLLDFFAVLCSRAAVYSPSPGGATGPGPTAVAPGPGSRVSCSALLTGPGASASNTLSELPPPPPAGPGGGDLDAGGGSGLEHTCVTELSSISGGGGGGGGGGGLGGGTPAQAATVETISLGEMSRLFDLKFVPSSGPGSAAGPALREDTLLVVPCVPRFVFHFVHLEAISQLDFKMWPWLESESGRPFQHLSEHHAAGVAMASSSSSTRAPEHP